MAKQYLKKCRQCGNLLLNDDIDYNFDGCQDEWDICNECNLLYFVKVRFGRICKVTKHKIDFEDYYND